MSGSENWLREEMTSKDTIDTCVLLYKQYENYTMAAEELAMPVRLLTKYVKYDALPPDLKSKVDKHEIKTNLAWRIQIAATSGGKYDKKKGQEMLEELPKVDNSLQQKFFDLQKRNPHVNTKKLLKKAQKNKLLKISPSLLPKVYNGLIRFAEEQGIVPDQAAAQCIEDSLAQSDYLDDADD